MTNPPSRNYNAKARRSLDPSRPWRGVDSGVERRQVEDDLGTGAQSGNHLHAPSLFLGGLAHDGKSKPRSVGFGGEIGFEQASPRGRVHARPCVADTHPDEGPVAIPTARTGVGSNGHGAAF